MRIPLSALHDISELNATFQTTWVPKEVAPKVEELKKQDVVIKQNELRKQDAVVKQNEVI